MTIPLSTSLQEAQQLIEKTSGCFLESDESTKILALDQLAKQIIPLVGKNLKSEECSLREHSIAMPLLEAEMHAQKWVLAHPELFPFFNQIFPNLSNSFEQLIERNLKKDLFTAELRRAVIYLAYVMPESKEALQQLIPKLEEICTYKVDVDSQLAAPYTIYEALARNCTSLDLLTEYVHNNSNVDKILIQKTIKYKIQRDLLTDPRIFTLISQLTTALGWGELPPCFEPRISELKNPSLEKLALSKFYDFLDAFEHSKVSREQFPLFVKNQALWLVLNDIDYLIGAAIMRMIGSIDEDKEKEKILEDSFQLFTENFPLSKLLLLPDHAKTFLVLLSLAPLWGISKEMCVVLIQTMLPHFTAKDDNNSLTMDRSLHIFNTILFRLLQTKDLSLMDKEYLLGRILKNPKPFVCTRMILAIKELDGLAALQKTKLEKSTFEDILRKALLANKGAIPAIRTSDSKEETKRDLLTEKMICEILQFEGFKKDDLRDKSYELKDKQTISEVQGTTAFCEKTLQFATEMPSVLSPSSLRIQQTITSMILMLKRFGHTFNLGAMVKLPNSTEVNLEGFNETFVIPMLRAMVDDFAVDRPDLISEELHRFVSEPLFKATWHENASEEKIAEIHKLIHDPSYPYAVVVGSGWIWHSTQVIFYKGRLYYCNRGADCKKEPGIVVLEIGDKDKITPEFLKKLAARLSVEHSEYTTLGEIKKELSATDLKYIPMKEQKVGNCIIANAKAAIFTLMKLGTSDDEKSAKQIYKAFSQFDKETILEDFLLALEETLSGKGTQDYLESFIKVATVFEKWIFAHRGETQKISSDLVLRGISLLCDIGCNNKLEVTL